MMVAQWYALLIRALSIHVYNAHTRYIWFVRLCVTNTQHEGKNKGLFWAEWAGKCICVLFPWIACYAHYTGCGVPVIFDSRAIYIPNFVAVAASLCTFQKAAHMCVHNFRIHCTTSHCQINKELADIDIFADSGDNGHLLYICIVNGFLAQTPNLCQIANTVLLFFKRKASTWYACSVVRELKNLKCPWTNKITATSLVYCLNEKPCQTDFLLISFICPFC